MGAKISGIWGLKYPEYGRGAKISYGRGAKRSGIWVG